MVDEPLSKSEHRERTLPERRFPIFNVSRRGEHSLINVGTDLDICSAASLASAIRLAATVAPDVIVSLEDCGYCDASGLSALLAAKAALGARLSIVVPLGLPVRRVFEITNMASILALCHDLNEAISGHADGLLS
jgi:anti-anti-sigma factor